MNRATGTRQWIGEFQRRKGGHFALTSAAETPEGSPTFLPTSGSEFEGHGPGQRQAEQRRRRDKRRMRRDHKGQQKLRHKKENQNRGVRERLR